MYAGVIGSAVHTASRRGLAIAVVHARFNLTNKGEKNAGRYTVQQVCRSFGFPGDKSV
jgi:hypothetical protein